MVPAASTVVVEPDWLISSIVTASVSSRSISPELLLLTIRISASVSMASSVVPTPAALPIPVAAFRITPPDAASTSSVPLLPPSMMPPLAVSTVMAASVEFNVSNRPRVILPSAVTLITPAVASNNAPLVMVTTSKSLPFAVESASAVTVNVPDAVI